MRSGWSGFMSAGVHRVIARAATNKRLAELTELLLLCLAGAESQHNFLVRHFLFAEALHTLKHAYLKVLMRFAHCELLVWVAYLQV